MVFCVARDFQFGFMITVGRCISADVYISLVLSGKLYIYVHYGFDLLTENELRIIYFSM